MDIDDSVSESKQKLQQDRQELAAVMAWAYATQKPALKIGGINVSIKTVRKKLSCITAIMHLKFYIILVNVNHEFVTVEIICLPVYSMKQTIRIFSDQKQESQRV